MMTLLKKITTLLITAIIFLPACTLQLQKDLDSQQERITGLERELIHARKNRADMVTEIDEIKNELQGIRGSLEENAHLTQQAALELKKKLEDLSFSLKQTQDRIASQRPPSAASQKKGSRKKPVSGADAKKTSYDSAYALFKAGKYSESRKLFEAFLKAYPNDTLTDNALYWVGNSYFKEKKYEKAISAFEDLIKQFPKSNKAPDAHYIQALAFLEINEPLTSKIILETLIQNFPSSPVASKAKKKLSTIK